MMVMIEELTAWTLFEWYGYQAGSDQNFFGTFE